MAKIKKVKKITKAKLKKLERREVKRQFKDWSILVKERDSNKCSICNRTDLLHAHHLLPRELKEFRFDVTNGITLCPYHHKYSIEISPHRNPLVFFNWLKENRNFQFEYVKMLSTNKKVKLE